MPTVLEVRAAALLPYSQISKDAVYSGWPGPDDRRVSEARAKYILVDTFARAVKGDSIDSVISFAESELKQTYRTRSPCAARETGSGRSRPFSPFP